MATANEDQITYWNEQGGPKWVEYHDRLDQEMEQAGLAAMDAADVHIGQSVLDIGCGCGATSIELGHRVGLEGRVLGVDISEPMLEFAEHRTREHGTHQVQFMKADAQVAEFEAGAFDRAFSRFGVMFFESPEQAFGNIRSALKPGGQLCFLCWRPIEENPWILVPLMAAGHVIDLPDAPEPGEPGPFSLGDSERVRAILQTAGFESITLTKHDADRGFIGKSIEEALEFIRKIGPLSRILADEDEATQECVLEAVRTAIAPHMKDDAMTLARAMWIVRAQNPG